MALKKLRIRRSEPLQRATIARISWRILPLIGLAYLFSLMDRLNVSLAALQMNQELKFSATVYGFGAGLFSLSYAIVEIPSTMLLTRFGARRWLARIMVTWGLIAAAMMFVRTPFQFYALRFLLGVAEAGFFPGVVYYLSHWFPRKVRGPRDQPLLFLRPAVVRDHGRRFATASQSSWAGGVERMAMAVPGRRPSRRLRRHRHVPAAPGFAEIGRLAGR